MKQLEFFEIPSPCIGVCQSGPKGYCIGCFRSRDERLYWQKLDDNTKRKVLKACNRRQKRANQLKNASTNHTQSPQQGALWDDN